MTAQAEPYRAAQGRGSPLRHDGKHRGGGAAGQTGGEPVLAGRGGLAASGLPGGDEHGQAHAGDSGAPPGDRADGLADPDPAQYEHEDQLDGQHRLNDRDLALVQRQRLEHERGDQGHPAEQPQRAAEQVNDQPPARGPVRGSGAGDVLGGLVDRVGQGGQQGKDDYHRCNPRPAGPAARPRLAPLRCVISCTAVGPSRADLAGRSQAARPRDRALPRPGPCRHIRWISG